MLFFDSTGTLTIDRGSFNLIGKCCFMNDGINNDAVQIISKFENLEFTKLFCSCRT